MKIFELPRSAVSLSATIACAVSLAFAGGVAADDNNAYPMTAWGVPDLQGIWDYSSRTAVERHPRFEGKLTVSQEVAEQLVPSLQQYTDALEERGAEAPGPHNVGGYNAFWINPGDWLAVVDGELRTSFIIEPEDGRIPWKETGRDVRAAQRARIVKIYGQHDPDGIPRWHGDSIGYYEGNTLVVETINFHPEQVARGSGYTSANAKITERFYQVNERELRYQFTIEDPDLYEVPWTGEMPMFAAPDLYEYACHEGNHSMPGILGGARVLEQMAADAIE